MVVSGNFTVEVISSLVVSYCLGYSVYVYVPGFQSFMIYVGFFTYIVTYTLYTEALISVENEVHVRLSVFSIYTEPKL